MYINTTFRIKHPKKILKLKVYFDHFWKSVENLHLSNGYFWRPYHIFRNNSWLVALAQTSWAVRWSGISFRTILRPFDGCVSRELSRLSHFFCPCRSVLVQKTYHTLAAFHYLASSLAVSRDDFSHACLSYSSKWKSDYSPAGSWMDKWKVFLSCGFLSGRRNYATFGSSWGNQGNRISKSLRTSESSGSWTWRFWMTSCLGCGAWIPSGLSLF